MTEQKKSNKKIGRPKLKEVEWVVFEKLCALHVLKKDFSELLGVSYDTLCRQIQDHYGAPFAEVYEQKKADGRRRLVAKQFEVAMNGNVAMLIWLGKQWLNQTDKNDIALGQSENHKPILTEVVFVNAKSGNPK